MKKKIYIAAAFLLLIYMVTNPLDAVAASQTGPLLWFNTIIPTLLPFIIISNLIVQLDGMKYLTFWMTPLLGRLLHLSRDGCYAVITGFLCGYPMGAKTAADLTRTGRISRAEGNYLLMFCNNVSPMFIISYIISQTLQAPALQSRTLIILYLSPVVCAFLFQPLYRYEEKRIVRPHPGTISKTTTGTLREPVLCSKKQPPAGFELIDHCIMDGFEAVVKLGGYIILFSILTRMAALLPVSGPVSTFMIGNIELTNGVQLLAQAGYSFSLTYILILAATSFGGLSSMAQTMSMLKNSGLSLGRYIPAKLINAGVTAFITLLSLQLYPL